MMIVNKLLCVILRPSFKSYYGIIKGNRQLFTSCLNYGKKFVDSDSRIEETKEELVELPDRKLYPEYNQEEFGVIYSKQPFKVTCQAGKSYFWCSCGRSHNQVNEMKRFLEFRVCQNPNGG